MNFIKKLKSLLILMPSVFAYDLANAADDRSISLASGTVHMVAQCNPINISFPDATIQLTDDYRGATNSYHKCGSEAFFSEGEKVQFSQMLHITGVYGTDKFDDIEVVVSNATNAVVVKPIIAYNLQLSIDLQIAWTYTASEETDEYPFEISIIRKEDVKNLVQFSTSCSLGYSSSKFSEVISTPKYRGNCLSRQPHHTLPGVKLDFVEYFRTEADVEVSNITLSYPAENLKWSKVASDLDENNNAINIYQLSWSYTVKSEHQGENLNFASTVVTK